MSEPGAGDQSPLESVAPGRRGLVRALFAPHRHGRLLLAAGLAGDWGRVWVPRGEWPPVAALLEAGWHFLGGDPHCPAAADLLRAVPARRLMLLPDRSWRLRLGRVCGPRLINAHRLWSFRGWRGDLARSTALVDRLPHGFVLEHVDAAAFPDDPRWDEMTAELFDGADSPTARGLGVCIRDGPRLVSTARILAVHGRCAELAVVTRPRYRRLGLAAAAASALLLDCRDRGWRPRWTAENRGSVRLALKLGFRSPRPFLAHTLTWGSR